MMSPGYRNRKNSRFGDRLARTLPGLMAAAVWLAANAPVAHAEDLRDKLEQLAQRHAFTIEGIEQIRPEEVPDSGNGELSAQLRELLRNYNHLMISGHGLAVEKVVILGIKRGSPGMPPDPAVSLTREGLHHRVQANLTGPNGRAIAVSLIIDTGASNIVLPESMISDLGFRVQDLQSSQSQTASGLLPVRLGTLKSVAIGQNRVSDVGVTFVEDQKLGALHLLGMSFLGRFRFTIDDEKSELILMAR